MIPVVTEEAKALASKIMDAYNSSDGEAFCTEFNDGLRGALSPEQALDVIKRLKGYLGDFMSLGPAVRTDHEHFKFVLNFQNGNLDLKLVIDAEGKVAGLWFVPHAADSPCPERNETEMVLPFKGEWSVVWGGETKELNRHHDVPCQRYAVDLFVKGDDGRTHSGDGRNNEDFHCFGKEVLSPGNGVVVEVIEGVRDNEPGFQNPYSAIGNAITIRHSDHEHSVIAHLKNGSVLVNAGDKVAQGQVIGQCGNSGLSYEPHIHFHLQNTPTMNEGTGIRPIFMKANVKRDGTTDVVVGYTPIKGDVISPCDG